MAKRRMISTEVFETDLFNDLPTSAQSLYTHYLLHADDDGMIGNPKLLRRMYGANEDDLKILIAKNYLIPFPDGVVAITHWKQMNNIRKDRYTSTIYKDDYQLLQLNDENVYRLIEAPVNNRLSTVSPQEDNHLTPNCQPVGMSSGIPNGMSTAVHSIVQDRSSQINLVQDRYITLPENNKSYPQVEIINYLNRKYSLHLNPNLTPTKRIINERLSEGYIVDDFYTLIDNLSKITSWNNEIEKKQALRPKIIFTKANFESLVDSSDQKKLSDKHSFSLDSQIKGIVGYLNKIFKEDINKHLCNELTIDDNVTSIIGQAINYFGNDQKLLHYLQERKDWLISPILAINYLDKHILDYRNRIEMTKHEK